MSRVTVGDLRQAIMGLPDEMWVVIPGSEWDQTNAASVDVVTLDWQTDEDGEAVEQPIPTRCLVIE